MLLNLVKNISKAKIPEFFFRTNIILNTKTQKTCRTCLFHRIRSYYENQNNSFNLIKHKLCSKESDLSANLVGWSVFFPKALGPNRL